RLRDVYPGTHQPRAHDSYLSRLEPDLLGEFLVSTVVGDPSTPHDWLDRIFSVIPNERRVYAFVVLWRAEEWQQPSLSARIDDFVRRAPGQRGRIGVMALIALGLHARVNPYQLLYRVWFRESVYKASESLDNHPAMDELARLLSKAGVKRDALPSMLSEFSLH